MVFLTNVSFPLVFSKILAHFNFHHHTNQNMTLHGICTTIVGIIIIQYLLKETVIIWGMLLFAEV